MPLPGFLPRPSVGPGHAVRRGACAAVMVWGAIFAAAGEAEARRLALVVGNGGYETVPKLTNAVGDARGVASALEGIGFEVTLLTDVTAPDFWAELDRFAAEADGAESTLFYYSGHAFQMSGVNYLIPVGATLDSREAIRAETWSLDGVIARLQDRRRQTLVFLDACRNDPLPAEVRGSGTADGLARLQTGAGTFVAFATEPGAVAYDGVDGAPHSPFTQALLDNLAVPGLSVSDMMIEVRNAVEDATGDRQTPWDQSSLREQFYFVPEEERKQELSDADFELLAQLPAEDRTKFIELLRASGFSEESLANAEAQIEVASLNLEIAADGGTTLGAAPVADPAAPELAGASVAPAPAPAPPAAPVAIAAAPAVVPAAPDELVFETVDGGVTLSGPQAPTAVAEAPAAPAAPQGEVLAALDPGLAVAPLPDTSAPAGVPSASSGPSRPAPAQPGLAAPLAEAPPAPDALVAPREETFAALAPGLLAPGAAGAAPSAPAGSAQGGLAAPLADAAPLILPEAFRPPPVQEEPPIRLAALSWETRGIIAINALTVDRIRLQGSEVAPDSDQGRAILSAIDPALGGMAAPAMDPKELASLTQTELKRLGCYQMRVDGDWGRGSQTALTSYFLAKKTVPDSLDPTPGLLDQLRAEDKVVCQVRVATAKPKVPKPKVTEAAASSSAGGTRKKASAPAPQAKQVEKSLKTIMGGF